MRDEIKAYVEQLPTNPAKTLLLINTINMLKRYIHIIYSFVCSNLHCRLGMLP